MAPVPLRMKSLPVTVPPATRSALQVEADKRGIKLSALIRAVLTVYADCLAEDPLQVDHILDHA